MTPITPQHMRRYILSETDNLQCNLVFPSSLTGLHEPVVEDDVDPGLHGLVRPLVGLLRRRVGALQVNLARLTGDKLRENRSNS